MTFEQFAFVWNDFKSSKIADRSMMITTARGSWEITTDEHLKIHQETKLFVYQEQPNGTKFIFDVSAIDHISYKD